MNEIKNDIKKLKGSEKSAVLFLCLGEERSSNLMRQMEEDEVFALTRAMAGLGMVTSEVVEDVITEFMEGMTSGGGVVGNFGAAEKFLGKFLSPEKVEEIMRDVRGPIKGKDLWERFSSLNEAVIAGYLKSENAQTVAAILSKVKADVTAKVLPLLGKEAMHDVIQRMIVMEAVPRDILEQIEDTLEAEFIMSASRASGPDSHQRMADVFNKLDLETFEGVSQALDEEMPDVFAKIKQKMFTFDDLARLDIQSLGRVIRAAEGNVMPTALKGAKKEVREYFLSALPERSRNMLLEEMNTMGPVRMKDVQNAQSSLVDVAKALAEDGSIQLPSNDDDDVMIE
ncbi:flagellar motor switch protein FliG [Sulfitobacter sp. R18_1]|uniref:flagellar motor switch protein FliG n=1 Tax=Sulfitobacter sp. R18_1 TaxID=2821104 RepID=UPI001ADBE618|nr:flagellar motor switch protein FliG [Sulfitobacter sp. R18_1]MBO9428627.1 flagellar motor switch protein FliG [Sulfitobacter sp. R18_1]